MRNGSQRRSGQHLIFEEIKMSERDLKDYIVKLNDRNIQRQRETGFTLYAILGVIIFCIIFLIDNLTTFVSVINDAAYLNIAIITANSLFILLIFFLYYSTKTSGRRLTKIFPNRELLKLNLEEFPIIIGLCSISALNFIFLSHSQNRLHYYYLLSFGILTGLNTVSPFAINLFKNIHRRKKIKKGFSIEEINFTLFSEQTVRAFSISFLVYAILLSFFFIIVLFNIRFNLESKQAAEVIKYVILFYGFLFLIETMIEINKKQRDNIQLEDFEMEIYFERLSNEDIAKRFEHEFSGIPFSKWIIQKNIEVVKFFDIKNQEFRATDLKMKDLDSIDREKFQYEFTGRLNDVINEQIRFLNETNDFVQKIADNFRNLKNYGSLNDQDVQQLSYAETFLNNNIQGFNNQYKNLSNKIAEKQS